MVHVWKELLVMRRQGSKMLELSYEARVSSKLLVNILEFSIEWNFASTNYGVEEEDLVTVLAKMAKSMDLLNRRLLAWLSN